MVCYLTAGRTQREEIQIKTLLNNSLWDAKHGTHRQEADCKKKKEESEVEVIENIAEFLDKKKNKIKS